MAVLTALLAGALAGWAFARGRPARLAAAGTAGLLAAGVAAVAAALGGDQWPLGVGLGVATGALVARGRPAASDQQPAASSQQPAASPLVAVLLALLLLRLGVALGDGLPLGPDEAQYWDWSRTLDLAYHSKPGGIAWLLAGWTALAGDGLVALRLLGLLLAAAAIALAGRLARGAGADPWLAAALAAVLPIHACAAGLVTTDVPLLLCWAGFLAVLLHTPAAGGAPAWWQAPALGLLLAAGVNAKYAMLYAPLALLPALALPQLRAWLRTPAPWLALAIGLCGLLPVLLWNAEHGWAGLQHVAGQAGGGARLWRPLEFLGGQLAVGLPASLLLPAAARWAWRVRRERPAAWLLATAALTPLAALLLVSLQAKVQPNWAAMAWIPAAVLVALWLREAAPWARRTAVAGAVLAALAAVLVAAAPGVRAHWPALPPSVPERKLAGFAELAIAVERQLAAAPGSLTLVAGYDLAAELAWHNRHRPRPWCANFGRRGSQYDLWGAPAAAVAGCDAVFAVELPREGDLAGDLLDHLPTGLRDDFAGVGAPQLVTVARGGRVWRRFLVVTLRGFDGRLDSARAPSGW